MMPMSSGLRGTNYLSHREKRRLRIMGQKSRDWLKRWFEEEGMTSDIEPSQLIALQCKCGSKLWYRKDLDPRTLGWIYRGESWYCSNACAGVEKQEPEAVEWAKRPYKYLYGGRKF